MNRAHYHRLRVYIEDTDIGGIVYYANYLKFAERARTEMLRDVGLSHAKMIEMDGLLLAVRKCEAEYIKPATLDDDLSIETNIVELNGVRLKIAQRIMRDTEHLTQVNTEIVCVNKEGRPVRFPASLAQILLTPMKIEKV